MAAVGREGWKAGKLREFATPPSGQRVGLLAEGFEADLFEKTERIGNRKLGRRVVCAVPIEFVLPTGRFAFRCAAPTGHQRLNFCLTAWVNIKKAGAKRGAQPFMTTGRVIVAIPAIQFQRRHRRSMRAINRNGQIQTAGFAAQGIHRHHNGSRRSDVTKHNQLCARRNRFQQTFHHLLFRHHRARQRSHHQLGPRSLTGPFPNSQHGPIFVIVQQHFIAGLQRKTLRYYVHARGGVFHKSQLAWPRTDKGGQLFAHRFQDFL